MNAQLVDLDLVNAARARLERALDLVNTIHDAGVELAELAGDPADPVAEVLELTAGDESDEAATVAERESEPPAPSESSQTKAPAAPLHSPPTVAAPPPRPDTSAKHEQRRATLAAVLAVYEARAGEWLGGSDVATAAGVHSTTAQSAARELLADDKLEHNGKGGAHSKYRAPRLDEPADVSAAVDEIGRKATPAILTAEEAAAKARAQDAPSSSSTNGHHDPATAAREASRRRTEAREQADARRRARLRELGHRATVGPPEPAHVALEPRIIASLKREAGTVLELARRLDAPARDITTAIRVLTSRRELVEIPVSSAEEPTRYTIP